MNNITIQGSNNCIVGSVNDNVYINGKMIPPPPGCSKGYRSTTIIDNEVFINGYEWKDGKWKRTLRALWHLIF